MSGLDDRKDFDPGYVEELHNFADTDSPLAIHHKIGINSNEVSAGTHTHNGKDSATLPATSITTHTHTESQVTNLTTDLAGKAPTVHTHAESDVTGLVADLGDKYIGKATQSSSVTGIGATETNVLQVASITLVSGQRYEVQGSAGAVWLSATNGQAIFRLRYASGGTVSSAGTQIDLDMHTYGETTSAATSDGMVILGDFIAPSSGTFTVGLFCVQGNTNATITVSTMRLVVKSTR